MTVILGSPESAEHVFTGTVFLWKYSKFESESKQRPLHCRIEQEAVLIVIHIQVAVTQDECVVFMDVPADSSNDLVRVIWYVKFEPPPPRSP